MAYVDTETLKRNIRVNFMPNVDVDGTVTVENAERYFMNLIDKTSTADVVEVKHGYLTYDPFLLDFTCSVCGYKQKTKGTYCCNCGAKMDGKDKNVPANGRSKGAIRDAIDYGGLYGNNFTMDVVDKAIRIHIMNSMRGKKPDKIIVSEDIFAGLMELMQVTYKFDGEAREYSFLGIPITKMEGMGEIVLCKNTDVVLEPEEGK